MIELSGLPKAELHVHIEGTLEPEQAFAFAERNRIHLKYPDPGALREAFRFTGPQPFLNLYYESMRALRTERDFEELAVAYLKRACAQNIKHAEIFFDPQAHLKRGVRFQTVIDGLWSALAHSVRDFGISTKLIMCFLRDEPARSAMEALELALPFRDRIIAVGLDSAEAGNPPANFMMVFERARAEGFLAVAHAGEDGPSQYVWQALDLLKVSRIDHGVRAMEDLRLIERLRRTRMPLTVCPLSNVRLGVVRNLTEHPLKSMLNAGLVATVNSDSPAYCGGHLAENFAQSRAALQLSDDEVADLARNSFEASFIDDATKRTYIAQIDATLTGAA